MAPWPAGRSVTFARTGPGTRRAAYAVPVTGTQTPARLRMPAESYFVLGAISQYIGAAWAVKTFDELDAPAVAWLRVVFAAAIAITITQTWRRGWTRAELVRAIPFGVVLGFMNLFFYIAIDRLPLGTAVAIEFIGPNGYGFGTYHSNFDSRAYVERIADPGFEQGVVMVRMLGTLALRLSNADILPFRFADYAERLRLGVAEILGPISEAKISVDVDGWFARVKEIAAVATRLESAIDGRLSAGRTGDFAALNDRLARLEQKLTDDAGAPQSRWYRHVFYGWNIYSLYDGQLFPGLTEALRLRDAARVKHESDRITRAFDRMLAELTAALSDLR